MTREYKLLNLQGPKKYSADKGIIPGEIVIMLSNFHRTMEVEIIDIAEVIESEKIQTYYIFENFNNKKEMSFVGIGRLSPVASELRYHVEACLTKSFGVGQAYSNRDEAIAALRH